MFSGRLFAPGLPGTGVEASGCWQDGELRLAAHMADVETLRIAAIDPEEVCHGRAS